MELLPSLTVNQRAEVLIFALRLKLRALLRRSLSVRLLIYQIVIALLLVSALAAAPAPLWVIVPVAWCAAFGLALAVYPLMRWVCALEV